jgi:hypothetical protein
MIDLEAKTMGLTNRRIPIKEFAIWWRTPLGLTDDLDLAIKRSNECDFDPNRMVIPVVVALSDTGDYEEFVR